MDTTLLNPEFDAALLGVSVDDVHRLTNSGGLSHVITTTGPAVTVEALTRWIAEREAAETAAGGLGG